MKQIKDHDKNQEQLPPIENIENEQESFFITAEELIRQFGESGEQKYLLKPILGKVGLSILYGEPDTGKSQFARQLVISIANNNSQFLDMDLTLTHGKAIYVSTEDGNSDTSDMLIKQFKGLGLSPNANLKFMFDYEDIIIKLTSELEKEPVDLIVLDGFADVFPGYDLNSNSQIRSALRPYDILAKKFKCNILLISHTNKAAYGQSPSHQNLQGAGALGQKPRTALQLSKGNSSEKFLSITKGNSISNDVKENAFILMFMEESLTFTNTGSTIPVSDITNANFEHDKKIDWLNSLATKAFENVSELSYTNLTNKIMEITKKEIATGKRKIKELLEAQIIVQDGRNYKMNSDSVEPEEGQPVNEEE